VRRERKEREKEEGVRRMTIWEFDEVLEERQRGFENLESLLR
jgi:hypothetical protein